jgi:signal transduction histidine kinase
VLYELYETQDYPGKNLHQFWRDALHPDDRDRVLSGISEIILGKKRKNIEEYRVLVGSEKKVKYVRTIAFAEKNTSNELKILGSTTDITDSKNYENQLIRNNEELKKINSELDQFVYSVSHDLRSPLLSVKGLLSLIKLAEGDHESEQFMGLIQKSINRLDATVLEFRVLTLTT